MDIACLTRGELWVLKLISFHKQTMEWKRGYTTILVIYYENNYLFTTFGDSLVDPRVKIMGSYIAECYEISEKCDWDANIPPYDIIIQGKSIIINVDGTRHLIEY